MKKERIKIECLKIASENWGESEQIIKQAKELFNYVTDEDKTSEDNVKITVFGKEARMVKPDEIDKLLNEGTIKEDEQKEGKEAYNEKGRTLVIKDALIKMYSMLLEDKEKGKRIQDEKKILEEYKALVKDYISHIDKTIAPQLTGEAKEITQENETFATRHGIDNIIK
jgi:hypothetical protein